ncbi:hypothetical protein JCM10450v2_008219 [Rhodotorula kratochvilovae]
MSSSSSHGGRHRSSADMYAQVPTSDATYPPIRTITPRSPEVVNPPYAAAPPDPQWLHTRSPSTQTFESQYSDGGNPAAAAGAGGAPQPYRLRGGAATQSGTWDDGATGHSYSPEGSQANLTALAAGAGIGGAAAGYRGVPTAGRSESFMKEYGAGADSPDGLATLRKGGKGGAGGGWWSRQSSRGKKWLVAALVLLLLVVAAAIAIPIGVIKSRDNSDEARRKADNDGTQKGIPTEVNPAPDWKTAAYGGNGSMVYLDDGSSFKYNNSFGGYWVSIPFNDTARAQRDVPALDEPWDYEKNLIQGVNIGGWLVLEPFIVPAMFEPFNLDGVNPGSADNKAIDEWTLCEQLGTDLEAKMTAHYDTFITEKDFAEIAGAGLNWVRIPFGWWAIETWDGEPFLANVAWTYILKAIEWARKYGLRVNLDFHALPGSQNGYNHSGKQGSINILNGVMGLANAQRALDYIRTVTEFISQPAYRNVVPMFSVMNEPYVQIYDMMRSIGGTGEGNGPWITFHDGFINFGNMSVGGFEGFLNGWDRVALDSHRYLCFDTQNEWGLSYQASLPCQYWSTNMNISTNQFGVTMGGEWSLAINDCGQWLNNVGNGERYEGTYYVPGNNTAPDPRFERVGDCAPWRDYSTWNQTTRDGLRLVAETHMDALRHWFFWTWKTGYSDQLGMIANPMWNYQLGLQEGYIPPNPRAVLGSCDAIGAEFGQSYSQVPASTLAPWMTGGAGAGTFADQAMYTQYSAWPPSSFGVASGSTLGPYATPVENLPTYTPTGSRITLATAAQPTAWPSGYNASSISNGNGWFQPSDTASFYRPVSSCSYVDPWSGAGVAIPTVAFCASDSPAAVVTAAETAVPPAADGGADARFKKRFVKATPQATLKFVPTPPPSPVATAPRRW